jgi:hypothetical protein
MRPRILPLYFVIAIITISFACNNPGSANRQVETPTRRPAHIEVDIPSLVFAKEDAVGKVLGASIGSQDDAFRTDLGEVPVITKFYSRATCQYFQGRLVKIRYSFQTAPATAADALEWSGFPRASVSLDHEHADHLPYLAIYVRNASYRNPIRCCGIMLQYVSIGADRSDIEVNFANMNERFRDWPEEIRSEWFRAGGDTFP